MDDRKQNLEANEGAPDQWCLLPWSHVSVTNSGLFRLCCHSAPGKNMGYFRDKDGKNYHVSNASWKDVYNSEDMKEVRRDMLNGKWPDMCVRCKRESNSGMTSRNIYERSSMANYVEADNYPSYQKAKALTNPDGSVNEEDFPVNLLDIRFGNLCNLKCVMCGTQNSNQWYDDYHAIWGYTSYRDGNQQVNLIKNEKGKLVPKNNIYDWDNDPKLWEEINSRIQGLRKIYIVGGEPLMIDAHYDFLQKCIDEGYAKDLVIEYNSNITNIPERAWKIWPNFKQIQIGVSIDGFGKPNDYIRFPSKWKKIEENLKKFTVVDGNFEIHITYTFQLLNVWQLPEFVEYMLESNYPRIGPWPTKPLMSPHPAHRPEYFNVNILPQEFKTQIENRFDSYKQKFLSTDYQEMLGNSNQATWEQKVDHACRILDNMKSFMYSINYTEEELINYRQQFLKVVDTLDSRRKTNWKEMFPEIYEATKDWYG